MSRKHFQKYYIFPSLASLALLLYACSTTKKVPDGEFLLTKNSFEYEDGKVLGDELPEYVTQKPNKKALMLFPFKLWMYNAANPKYDSVLTEFFTYPSTMRDKDLRDSLFIKAGHPEYAGKSIFPNRLFRGWGEAPSILSRSETDKSAREVEKRLVYRGYWDADVEHEIKRDSANKKAKVTYQIEHKDPTYISEYYYDIPDPQIKSIYERDLDKSLVLSKEVLDQTVLEQEVQRINKRMREEGFYHFNNSNQEIFFTADTLSSRKQVPLTMEIHKDSLDTPYKRAKVGKIQVIVVNEPKDYPSKITINDTLRGITFHKVDDRYKTNALWRGIISRKGEVYNQDNLDLTKRNLIAMNNFNIVKADDDWLKNPDNSVSDSLISLTYMLQPLDKYDLRTALEGNWSQLLNISINPSVNLTARNVFGGAENISGSISGVYGSVVNPRNIDKRIGAYELSGQVNLSFPKLLLPFNYYKLIPKRYTPSSNINLGISDQKNIGLGRTTFSTGLTYNANVNNIVSHRLTIFNTQLSLTKNKNKYYDFFTAEKQYRDQLYMLYSPALFEQMDKTITSDEIAQIIINDTAFTNSLSGEERNLYNNFRQSLLNKDRQTQDVLIASLIYNFRYDEKGKAEFENPFYFNGSVELSGNLLSLIKSQNRESGITTGTQKSFFNIPLSQFAKVDLDFRKFFKYGFGTLGFRQFIGVGIPYGNSNSMPFIRSYFNGGSNDIRAWTAFGGLGPADSQLDERIRTYLMGNVKLTSSVELRLPLNEMYEGAIFTDAGNTWNLEESGYGDEFKFNKFLSQMGVGSGLGLRIKASYIIARIDLAYKVYDPNKPEGARWRLNKFQPLKPTLNLAIGYPF